VELDFAPNGKTTVIEGELHPPLRNIVKAGASIPGVYKFPRNLVLDGQTEYSLVPGQKLSIYFKDTGYSKYFKTDFLAVDIPKKMMYNDDDVFVMTDAQVGDRLSTNTEMYGFLNPNIQTLLTERAYVGINRQAEAGKEYSVFVSNVPKIKLYKRLDDLRIRNNICELKDRRYPFSNRYMLVFVNNRLVNPDDIVEISNYKFGFRSVESSIWSVDIYIHSIEEDWSPLTGQLTKWDIYIDAQDDESINNVLGLASFQVVSVPLSEEYPTNTNLYLYEILNKYLLSQGYLPPDIYNQILQEIPYLFQE
jgi:hypothetical protein